MTAVELGYYDQLTSPAATTDPLSRWKWQPAFMAIPVVIAGVSMALGGIKPISDVAFVVLSILCAVFLVSELLVFNKRFGIGGIVLYGGVLVWFSYDYLSHWAFHDFGVAGIPFGEEPVTRSVFYHCLFILMMSIGLRFRRGRWLPRFLTSIPEPGNPNFYLFIIIALELVGLSPYVFFTRDPFYVSIWRAFWAGRSGVDGVSWTVGRTGNVNYNWGGYVAQILQVGQMGGVLAAFHLFFLARSTWQKVLDGLVWSLWLMFAFGSGARTEVSHMVLPLMAFGFIRYSSDATELLRKISLKAYIFMAVIAVLAIFAIQIQISFRNSGFEDTDISSVDYLDIQGNSMFSEGLMGFSLVPEQQPFLFDKWPGAALLLPIPNCLFWGAISPIPRALWTAKPIDPEWEWYNSVVTGRNINDTEGTTIAFGLVGGWYFPWGPLGVIEGGLFTGWLMLCGEWALQENRGKPIAIMMAVAFETWLFQCYRAMQFYLLHGLLVGMVTMTTLVFLTRAFFPPTEGRAVNK